MHSRKIISIPVEGAVRPANGHGGRGERRTTETVPCELTETAQWMGWRGEQAGDDGKHKKVPVHPETGRKTNPHDPSVWRTYPETVATAREHGLNGVGFVVTEVDDFCCVDIDKCVNPDTREVAPWAVEIVDLLDSYTEISPTGTGLKTWVRATKPGVRCKDGNIENVEVYDSKRFLTVTGERYGNGRGIEERQTQVEELYERLFDEGEEEHHAHEMFVVGDGFGGSDEELIERARNAANGFRFRALYDRGEIAAYGNDPSRADMALLGMLAFWTGRDPERMERLFDGSALGERDKWRERADYRRRSIDKAIQRCVVVYHGTLPEAEPVVKMRLERVAALVNRLAWDYPGGETDRKVLRGMIETGGTTLPSAGTE